MDAFAEASSKNVPSARFISVALILSLFSVHGQSAYTPPNARVNPLNPKGLRISIPDEAGITSVVFHVKFNDEFVGLEAGGIATEIVQADKGRWTYRDRTTVLRPGDIVYYWIHIVHNGLEYNLIDQEYHVTRLFNLDEIENDNTPTCSLASVTKVVEVSGEQRDTCPGQLIFEDNFVTLNTSVWQVLEEFSSVPNYEFVVYRNNVENVDVIKGNLRIKPTLVDEKYGGEFPRRGSLALEGCTGTPNTIECARRALGPIILPPVISARLNTNKTFRFVYGRVEIKAKLPKGDWIYPLLTLQSVDNTGKDGRVYSEIRIVGTFGNAILVAEDGTSLSGHVIWAGGLSLSGVNASANVYTSRLDLPRVPYSLLWSRDFHIYEIEWRDRRLIAKVDGKQYGSQNLGSSFNSACFLTLGLGVGGHLEFPDNITSGGYEKPWRNYSPKADLRFFNAKNDWRNTWTSTSSKLEIDYIRVWAL